MQEVALVEPQVRRAAAPGAMVLGFAVSKTVGEDARTVTVADCEALPPAPVHISMNVVLAFSAAEASVPPPTDLTPLQPPEAEQEVALLLDHFKVAVPPGSTVLGLVLSFTTGGKAVTVTVVDWVTNPPAPRQVKSYSVVLESEPVDQDPLVATEPFQPPLAEQEVAFFAVQESVALDPAVTVDGVADKTRPGVGAMTTTSTDCEALPPGPLQVSVYREFLLSGAVAALPLVARVPFQAPDAVQEVALVLLHCNVAALSTGTVSSAAFRVTVGSGSTPVDIRSVIEVSPEADSPQAVNNPRPAQSARPAQVRELASERRAVSIMRSGEGRMSRALPGAVFPNERLRHFNVIAHLRCKSSRLLCPADHSAASANLWKRDDPRVFEVCQPVAICKRVDRTRQFPAFAMRVPSRARTLGQDARASLKVRLCLCQKPGLLMTRKSK
jgi:hypothetical protein